MKYLLAALALCAAPAAADPPLCTRQDELTKVLEDRWGETPTAVGLDAGGAMVMLFVSPAGTWTIAVVGADGQACLVAAGVSWTVAPGGING